MGSLPLIEIELRGLTMFFAFFYNTDNESADELQAVLLFFFLKFSPSIFHPIYFGSMIPAHVYDKRYFFSLTLILNINDEGEGVELFRTEENLMGMSRVQLISLISVLRADAEAAGKTVTTWLCLGCPLMMTLGTDGRVI